jgi:hypothetical protein
VLKQFGVKSFDELAAKFKALEEQEAKLKLQIQQDEESRAAAVVQSRLSEMSDEHMVKFLDEFITENKLNGDEVAKDMEMIVNTTELKHVPRMVTAAARGLGNVRQLNEQLAKDLAAAKAECASYAQKLDVLQKEKAAKLQPNQRYVKFPMIQTAPVTASASHTSLPPAHVVDEVDEMSKWDDMRRRMLSNGGNVDELRKRLKQ